MKNNKGVTLVNVLIIIIVLIIIAGISIVGGRDILNNSKDSQKNENLSSVKAVVNNISIKINSAGVLAPADTKVYGKIASNILSGDASLKDWYILDKEDLEEMGVTYIDETYLVNYKENKVISMSDYIENGID